MHRQKLIRIVAIVIIATMVITTLFASIGSLFY
ncbi:stressosome-associated protein Prli42 [Paenibacillus sp. N4]|nr:stressosome-associated protein Prli42 [Paenibacillus vietnamensis]MCA0754492.1 stressosome-associated protein Prli42 [Paenibacillus vietnamensis]